MWSRIAASRICTRSPRELQICSAKQVLRFIDERIILPLASTQRKEVIRCLMVQQRGRKGVFVGHRR